ncbi:hypothetical protein GE21DRAFT_7764 [Neurospora crassa]|uniref:Uncharacterized protein n=1 Tax=Neurospora crassa (strain ATCC 24698 / 74-OR23-1A / CBS 708.71 / DSM 1257 / FGSC 987) TaxID=367110 RepID=Q7RVW1_NEUCR|nr:hypothetical protein NCU01334 [Neurospora crassa OR74A]EAA32184.3 hypothetical protein NCU01334 [Neurospora crassa OR74A]KHE83476.1 hypothetical protein GE21DRAFT_7764 [Neurospora crassa]|eukprot:XP_961420.3 hypothetical protein NCU01334 [Neurospora crassa OR74A]
MTLTSILLPRWITCSVPSPQTSHNHGRHHKHYHIIIHDSSSPVHVAAVSGGFHDYIGLHQRCQTPVVNDLVQVFRDYNNPSDSAAKSVVSFAPIKDRHAKHAKQQTEQEEKLKCIPFPDPRFCSSGGRLHANSTTGLGPGPPSSPPPPSFPPNNPNNPIPDPVDPSNPKPKPGPDIPDPGSSSHQQEEEPRRFFCNMWKSTAFLMNLFVVLEVATLVGFVVLLVLGDGGGHHQDVRRRRRRGSRGSGSGRGGRGGQGGRGGEESLLGGQHGGQHGGRDEQGGQGEQDGSNGPNGPNGQGNGFMSERHSRLVTIVRRALTIGNLYSLRAEDAGYRQTESMGICVHSSQVRNTDTLKVMVDQGNRDLADQIGVCIIHLPKGI